MTLPSAPLNPRTAAVRAARPPAVTLLAVLAVAFGTFGASCLGFAAIGNLMAAGTTKITLPGGAGSVDQSPRVQAFSAAAGVVEWLIGVVLLIGGLGALRLRPWAWRLLMPWSAVTLAWAGVQLVAMLRWTGPATLRLFNQLPPSVRAAQHIPPPHELARLVYGQAILHCVALCLLPMSFLIFWTRPNVRQAFARADIVTKSMDGA